MKYLLLSLAICIAIISGARAQVTPNGQRSDQINLKMGEIDALLQLMPLLLTKDQINTKILPAIEKARDDYRKELQFEDDALAKLEPLLDDAIKNAYEKGAYPPRTMTAEVADKTAKLSLQRKIFVGSLVETMNDMLTVTLNAGQKKALIGSFDPRFIDPAAKPGTITDDAKMHFFIQRVFLDPITYDVLKKLAKLAN